MKYLYLLPIVLSFVGCTKEPIFVEQDEFLSQKLISIDDSISKKQASKISYKILQVSKNIQDEFNPVSYPWINNTLVNLGIKEKGLCWEWRDELYSRLYGKIEPLQMQKVVANKGKLSEHNAIVLLSKSNDIQNSILIDLWRFSGIPYIVITKDDDSYIWSVMKK
jgi:hypothetical protein